MKRLETRFIIKTLTDTSDKCVQRKEWTTMTFFCFFHTHRHTQQLRRNLETSSAEAPIYVYIYIIKEIYNRLNWFSWDERLFFFVYTRDNRQSSSPLYLQRSENYKRHVNYCPLSIFTINYRTLYDCHLILDMELIISLLRFTLRLSSRSSTDNSLLELIDSVGFRMSYWFILSTKLCHRFCCSSRQMDAAVTHLWFHIDFLHFVASEKGIV